MSFYLNNHCQEQNTDLRGRDVNIPVSYSGGRGFIVGPEAGYPVWGVLWFSSVTPGKYWNNNLNYATAEAAIHHTVIIYSSWLYNPSYWESIFK
jgi:hypothetical protein